MKPNMKLVGEPPPRTPEREALAEAIARRDAATKQLARVQAALDRASDAVYDSKDGVDKAIAALDEAKADEGRHLTAVALGEADAALSPVKTAAAVVEQANEQLATARAMRTALEAEIKTAENDLMWTKNKIDDAVSAAVKTDPAVRQLVADFEAASKTYAELRQAMNVVRRERMPDTPGSWDSVRNWSELPAATAWKVAIDALASDADALLPS
jgi:chromosome segregation ATPase